MKKIKLLLIITPLLYFVIFLSIYAQDSTYLTPIKSDFQVNENAGESGAEQYSPAISKSSDGSYVVTWTDERNVYLDIYAQKFSSSGEAIGNNFKVNEQNGGCSQSAVSTHNDGSFIIAWSQINDKKVFPEHEIFAQRYNKNCEPIGNNFIVSSRDSQYFQCRFPAISFAADGSFAVTWEDNNEYGNIFVKFFSNSGEAIANSFKVNKKNNYLSYCLAPSIKNITNEAFIITWTYELNGIKNIYAQKYSVDGLKLGNNFQVNELSVNGFYDRVSIASDNTGNFTIVWEDNRDGYNFCAQKFDRQGSKIGVNFQINDFAGINYSPSIIMDDNDNLKCSWVNRADFHADVYIQKFDSTGNKIGQSIKANNAVGDAGWADPQAYVASDSSGDYVVAWGDYRTTSPDIYIQQFSKDDIPQETNSKVNDDCGSASQRNPRIWVDKKDNFIITWADERNGVYDLYAQRFSKNAELISGNFKVNDSYELHDAGWFGIGEHRVSFDSLGNFVITWVGENEGSLDIYAQRYSVDGIPLGENVKVNDGEGAYWYTAWAYISIDTDKSGNYVITWMDGRTHKYSNIYAQMYDKNGIPMGNNFRVNDATGNNRQYAPQVLLLDNGNFIIAWADNRFGDTYNTNEHIFAQLYAADGTAIDSNFIVSEISGNISSPTIFKKNSGDFTIKWKDSNNDTHKTVAQNFTSDGSKKGNNFDLYVDEELYHSSIILDGDGNYLVIKIEEENENTFQTVERYTFEGDPIGEKFRITNSGSEFYIKLVNGKIYSTWQDNRGTPTGHDIWANIFDANFPPTNINEEFVHEIPKNFSLSQNYPNPFNPSTIIKYSIPSSSVISNPKRGERSHNFNMENSPYGRNDNVNVVLRVYDILGREVTTLINAKQKPGNYEVTWSSESHPSGVYFYQIFTNDFVETKKMVLLR